MGQEPVHRKRCVRWDIPWDAHFLTFSCYQRQPFFLRHRPRQWFLDALRQARRRHAFDLWGFVIMPEHVHLLIFPAEGVRIGPLLQSLKQPVTQRAIAWLRGHDPNGLERLCHLGPDGRRSHRFWQRGGGYDRNMRSVRETHEKLHYIHANPLSRGLVAQPEDWELSSARAWATGLDEPVAIDRGSFPPLDLTRP